jgi:NhaA family Na+:H+ antiporter
MSEERAPRRLIQPVDPRRDHVRGGKGVDDPVTVVVYGDFLCPYCHRLVQVLRQIRRELGDRLVYVFRHFPNERANPGALVAARAAEAAGAQGRFWEMHDALLDRSPPVTEDDLLQMATALGLDADRFRRDLRDPVVQQRVEADLETGRRNGVRGTPTLFVDGVRYDGAWDFYSLMEALKRPPAAQLLRAARAFASLPASAGLVLVVAAALAIICANSPLAEIYQRTIDARAEVGLAGLRLSLTVGAWCSEGLLAIFFLLVGLEIRRWTTEGALKDPRAAALPVLAAVGGVVAPAAIFLALNRGPTSAAWAVPTATDIAFALGVLALLGDRVPIGLRVFVAALAVADDVLSVLTLVVFYSHGVNLPWLGTAVLGVGALWLLNSTRLYAAWPYVVVTAGVWLALHIAGVHAALAGLALAAFLPKRPPPSVGPLLAQAATALAALEHAERPAAPSCAPDAAADPGQVADWAGENLLAASERLIAPAERVERSVAPWAAYVVLPLFAFSAAGASLQLDWRAPEAGRLLLGVVLGLAVGKPLGILLVSFAAVRARIAIAPATDLRTFIGAACVCGVGDTFSLLLADQAFPQGPYVAIAKVGVLAGSATAALAGAILVLTTPPARTAAQ